MKKIRLKTILQSHLKNRKFVHAKSNATGKKKRLNQKGLKRKLLLRFMLITVSICIVFGGTTVFLIYQNSVNFMKEEVDASAKAYSQVVMNSLGKYRTAVTDISEDSKLNDASLSEEDLIQELDYQSMIHGFFKVDLADDSGKTLKGDDISGEEYFKEASNGRFSTSSTYYSKEDSGMLVTMAVPMSAPSNSANILSNRVLTCSISVGTLNGLLDEVTIGKSGYGFIVDRTGKIVADKDVGHVLDAVNYIELAKKDASYSGMGKVVQQMSEMKTGGQETTLDGKQVYISYRPVSNADDWSIAMVAVKSEMLGGMYTAIYITLALVAAFILLSILISGGIAGPIIKPILSLAGRIETLADGDLHSAVPVVHTKDEVESLSQTFGSTVKSLNGYIEEISAVLGNMADGDFTVMPQREYLGDFAAIKKAMDSILLSMNLMFGEIRKMADQVAGGAQQTAEGANALAQGATEQAGTIEQLAASMKEVTQKVNDSVQYTQKADSLVLNVTRQVTQGSQQMKQMIAAMARIEESSGKIEKINKTIEDIAFQTNILALNAAVEAARAGEAGRGFSVVADEVRNLAGKSSEAAKDTSALIQDSIGAVAEGHKIADDTSASLNGIVDGVESMAQLFGSISRASSEQAKAIGQINQGSEQISAVVQSNSATAEQSSATSQELNRLAQMLKTTLSQLKLQDNS
ncbi:MAG: methyl-accepting chemotaxis protein [Oscillospiraceae bacterium]|nr:methyl-accepting chemotaxis protein [Oscillospiraceae bacterium]